ncbi:MAG: sigma-70 family RNA polymerase sigma factor [candidate division KSB1 bacterium]|nr:sigma-70 family RNA polymerase sigma factor [candidate division KSB1 bacterium]
MEEPDLDERSIILRCQQGDRQAYGHLVTRYMKRAYFIALGLVGSHEHALDLSQEAFVRGYRSIDRLNPEQKFFTWYYQILRNLCFNHLRDTARHARSFSAIGEASILQITDSTQDITAAVERQEMIEALWTAIEELKPQEREMIMLKDFQEFSYQEIAETLDCPIGTVMSRLFHARKALKQKMETYFHE